MGKKWGWVILWMLVGMVGVLGGSHGLARVTFADPPRGEVRIAIISDLNSAYGSTTYEPEVHQAIAALPRWRPDLVLCSGDMVAGQNPRLTAAQIQAMWTAFDLTVAQPLRQQQIPFGFTLGNHDASSAQDRQQQWRFAQERRLAAAYWQNPAHDPGLTFIDRQDFPFYYTFRYKDIFFLVWDGSSAQIPPDKLAWIERTLASPAAQQAKLRLAIGHLPLYGIAEGRNKPGEVMANADSLRNLLERYKVHTFISGHQHAYYPGRRGHLELLHTGLLGAGPRKLLGQSHPSPKTLTLLDVTLSSPSPRLQNTTYNVKTGQKIEITTLPRFILGHNGRVMRRDITPQQLTPTEQRHCEKTLTPSLCNL